MRPVVRAHLQIHFAVLLWGFTSILGKEISLPAVELVRWRMIIAVAVVALSPRVWMACLGVSRRLAFAHAGAGALLATHWLTFFGAIKLSNASVAAACLGLAPAFVAVIDPFVGRRPFSLRELLLGVAVAPGVALVARGVPVRMHLGILVGVLSAGLVAIYGAVNKRLVGRADALAVTWLQLGAGALLLSVAAPLLEHALWALTIPRTRDAALLVFLAVGCTILPFGAYLAALRHLPAFTVQLTANLEPVYAIVLAIVFLGEEHQLDGSFYAGAAVILGAVFAQPAMTRSRAAPRSHP